MNVNSFKTPVIAAAAPGVTARRPIWRAGIATYPLSRRELRHIIAETLG